ncbi:hypothetical protein RRG08_016649 [Elysia crispata]|uniref:Uncharacterized protein n=1 Tax=Elysia crispata TaxID=231223 RepID=A0AAE1D9A6_9GAST|nr:hypothetical protein RRG08_016649 [Elysia crispata]
MGTLARRVVYGLDRGGYNMGTLARRVVILEGLDRWGYNIGGLARRVVVILSGATRSLTHRLMGPQPLGELAKWFRYDSMQIDNPKTLVTAGTIEECQLSAMKRYGKRLYRLKDSPQCE